MTINDIREIMVDDSQQKIKVYDFSKDFELIYDGYADEVPEELGDAEICSMDLIEKDGYMGFNVEMEEN